jgi:hypothetical protein
VTGSLTKIQSNRYNYSRGLTLFSGDEGVLFGDGVWINTYGSRGVFSEDA